MTLTRACIIKAVSNNTGFSKKRCAQLFERLVETIKETLGSGEDILITNFGKFSVRNNDKRIRRKNNINEDFVPEARRVVCFRCSPKLRVKISAQ